MSAAALSFSGRIPMRPVKALSPFAAGWTSFGLTPLKNGLIMDHSIRP
jgi:hypothetical protein